MRQLLRQLVDRLLRRRVLSRDARHRLLCRRQLLLQRRLRLHVLGFVGVIAAVVVVARHLLVQSLGQLGDGVVLGRQFVRQTVNLLVAHGQRAVADLLLLLQLPAQLGDRFFGPQFLLERC